MLTSSDSNLSPLANCCELALAVPPLLHPEYHPNQIWGRQENLHSSGSERKARSIKKEQMKNLGFKPKLKSSPQQCSGAKKEGSLRNQDS
jgi:hypothetical protein